MKYEEKWEDNKQEGTFFNLKKHLKEDGWEEMERK
jgi:hypothetical protein